MNREQIKQIIRMYTIISFISKLVSLVSCKKADSQLQ